MLKNIRHKKIMDIIEKEGFISTASIAETFNVSIATARRDLDEMETMGFLKKKYGGAESVSSTPYKIDSFSNRRLSEHEEKTAMARAVADLVPANAVIALDAGSTVYEVCSLLGQRSDLTIICSDIHAAERLIADNSGNKIYLIGGFLTSDGSSSCDFADKLLERIAEIDLFICSGDGFSTTDGITSFGYGMNELNRSYIKKAKRTVALIDNTKFSHKGFYKMCDISDIDTLILDSKVSKEVLASFDARGIRYIVAQ